MQGFFMSLYFEFEDLFLLMRRLRLLIHIRVRKRALKFRALDSKKKRAVDMLT